MLKKLAAKNHMRINPAKLELAAIILAAGKGKRIGQPKWQLLHKGKTFLDIIETKLQAIAISQIVCVTRVDSLPKAQKIAITINPQPKNGMISSIYYGVKTFPFASGYLIFPVDHPFVTQKTLRTLKQAFTKNKNAVIRPIYKGRAGHPIIIPRKVAIKLTAKDYAGGLKQFLLERQIAICEVAVDDENVLKNINETKDFASQ